MQGIMAAKHLYSDGDMAQLLRALAFTAAASSGNDSPHAAAYRRGFAAAIAAVAVATGVPPEDMTRDLATAADWLSAPADATPRLVACEGFSRLEGVRR